MCNSKLLALGVILGFADSRSAADACSTQTVVSAPTGRADSACKACDSKEEKHSDQGYYPNFARKSAAAQAA